MKVLVFNCGSSTIKYQMIETDAQLALAKGSVERIGMSEGVLTHKPYDRDSVKISGEIVDHIKGTEYVISILMSKNHGVIQDKSEIDAIGHRVVHGGEAFSESVLITDAVIKEIRNCIEFAPLHNPHNLRGINACSQTLPGIPQVAVFDTAFHQQMPEEAYFYPIPLKLYKKYGIRRYGFHGTSHYFVSRQAAKLLNRPIEQLKMVTLHLGNGCSATAVKEGISIDTSMGFTPLEGLVMGTRCGDIDPAVVLHLLGREELTLHEGNTLLNKHSGLIGLSGFSSDMRDIFEEAQNGNKRAKIALKVFCYRLKKYIGSYAVAMGGIDAVVFTAGIGENAWFVREKTMAGMEFLGFRIDPEKNKESVNEPRDISGEKATARVLVVPTNEELVIALEAARIVEGKH